MDVIYELEEEIVTYRDLIDGISNEIQELLKEISINEETQDHKSFKLIMKLYQLGKHRDLNYQKLKERETWKAKIEKQIKE